jgi:hypothetical protein
LKEPETALLFVSERETKLGIKNEPKQYKNEQSGQKQLNFYTKY